MLISGGVTRNKIGSFLNKKHLVETQGTAISATYHEIGTRLLSSPWCFQCFPRWIPMVAWWFRGPAPKIHDAPWTCHNRKRFAAHQRREFGVWGKPIKKIWLTEMKKPSTTICRYKYIYIYYMYIYALPEGCAIWWLCWCKSDSCSKHETIYHASWVAYAHFIQIIPPPKYVLLWDLQVASIFA